MNKLSYNFFQKITNRYTHREEKGRKQEGSCIGRQNMLTERKQMKEKCVQLTKFTDVVMICI